MTLVKAFAATGPAAPLEPFQYELGPIGDDEVDIAVKYCGICHSDLSMINNEWGMSQYPLVAGHEVAGIVAAVGARVKNHKVGDSVGLGWYSRSCMVCEQCLAGDHNLCPTAEATIIGRHGGFASHVRAQALWVTPLTAQVDTTKAGPLFCGGITVFNPIVQNDVRPTHHVGVVGIGGLGHLALRFLAAWGCEVTAFSTSPDKEAEAREMGAHHFVATRDPDALSAIAGTLDMILVTVNVPLDWNAYVAALKPRGKLHIVGAAPEVAAAVFPLLAAQRSIGGSPLGSPKTTRDMLNFAARHHVEAIVERFPMSRINDAFDRLKSGKARYRIVLDNDIA